MVIKKRLKLTSGEEYIKMQGGRAKVEKLQENVNYELWNFCANVKIQWPVL